MISLPEEISGLSNRYICFCLSFLKANRERGVASCLMINEMVSEDYSTRQSNEEFSECQTVLNELPYAVQVVDGECIIYCNEATLNLFDAETLVEILNKPVSILSPDKQPDGTVSWDLFPEYINRAMAGEKITLDWTHRTLHSRLIPCEITLHAIRFRGKTCLMVTE